MDSCRKELSALRKLLRISMALRDADEARRVRAGAPRRKVRRGD
jgi:hypothetical protein